MGSLAALSSHGLRMAVFRGRKFSGVQVAVLSASSNYATCKSPNIAEISTVVDVIREVLRWGEFLDGNTVPVHNWRNLIHGAHNDEDESSEEMEEFEPAEATDVDFEDRCYHD
ncbi:hypothetical protein CC78DRAFT_584790 [Lojkania enalia]|uniref:Uncharacterized protein n=1 Tax=Lojkania enalia TaxID=147567 RepID=A0A9P4N391_9PLEO|nr:hypothetical protein CC78DRAFT_584790 [Didymosphaeria enalia]